MTSLPFTYRAYGAVVGSDLELPELERVSAGAHDVAVRVASAEGAWPAEPLPWQRLLVADGETWASSCRVGGALLLRFHGLADFLIEGGGSEIVVRGMPETPESTVRQLLIDQALPRVLHLRGHEVIHASAIAMASGACAFLGPSGSGKSTLAAACQRMGDRLLSDDALVIDEREGEVWATPSYPGVRLWEDPAQTAARVKRRVTIPASIDHRPVRLVRLYVLERAARLLPAPRIEPIAGKEAAMALIGSSFRLELTDRARLHREFERLTALAEKVPVRRLVVPDSLEELPRVRAAIVSDLPAE